MSLSERDRCLIWHPFTQEKLTPPPMPIKQAKGCYLIDEQDNEYLDLVSSWWVNIHGHAQPQIAQAIYKQCLTLEHVIFARFTHEPAVKLCENLRKLLPDQLCRFFFSDNGSTSVEVSLKMAYQYWKNLGKEKNLFLSFIGGYHGDTVGCMSVGQQSHFHDPFKGLCFEVRFVPYADTWEGDTAVVEKEVEAIKIMNEHLAKCGDQIAALIIEPLLQGAAGMRMCRPQFIAAIVQLARKHQILVIFDEVAAGFGRTGTNFAHEQVGVVPDFLCLSKGITGGFLPLAVTVTTEKVYAAFLGESHDKTFLHGHSYTANPVGCAAAIASLELLSSQRTQQSIRDIGDVHQEQIFDLQREFGCIEHARTLGTIAAFELELDNLQLFADICRSKGIIIRPLGKTVYMMPPYCITRDELKRAYNILRTCIQESLSRNE
ncbi:hypothetical protein V9T40_005722 [Parthenolecanium corni]|uniref:Uncharacterized protein n=1 Tax=Parthenolecanium corni TaxID=536013 RepID=A0AAN9Y9W7_9HEMI